MHLVKEQNKIKIEQYESLEKKILNLFVKNLPFSSSVHSNSKSKQLQGTHLFTHKMIPIQNIKQTISFKLRKYNSTLHIRKISFFIFFNIFNMNNFFYIFGKLFFKIRNKIKEFLRVVKINFNFKIISSQSFSTISNV